MPATGFVLPTSQSNDTLTSTAWSAQANALINDDTEAIEAITAKNTPGTGSVTTGWLKLYFPSLVPKGSVIDKVEIQVRWRMNSTSGIGNRDICWAVSGTRGTNTHSLTTEPTSLETTTIDVTAERAWTSDDLQSGVFEVDVRGRNGNSTSDPSYRFAWVKVQVTYTAPTPVNETIIDDYNRADADINAGVGGKIWRAETMEGGNIQRVISNQLALSANGVDGGGSEDSCVSRLRLARDFDLLVDYVVAEASVPSQFYFCVENWGSAALLDGTELYMAASWVLRDNIVGGTSSTLASITKPATWAAGSTLWIAKRGTTITVYHRPSGGEFVQVLKASGTATRWDREGFFGFKQGSYSYQAARFDNLRGGPLILPPRSVVII